MSFIYACTNCYIPIANAGDDELWAVGVTVELNGEMSSDPEGASLTYLWTPPEGISLSNNLISNPTFDSSGLVGNYVFSLVVNDGEFDSDPSNVTITITPNTPPSVLFKKDALEVVVDQEFVLDASSSNDSNSLTGDLLFDWVDVSSVFEVMTDNDVVNSTDAKIKYKAPSSVVADTPHTITLNVCDGDSNNGFLCSSSSVIVTVIFNQKPVAVPGPDQAVPYGQIIELDASDSYDLDGLISSYQWTIPNDFTVIEGSLSSTSLKVQHPSGAVNGDQYTITLTVNDGIDNSKLNLGQDLFISDYCAHPDDTDAWSLEIYNPTDMDIFLSEYGIISERSFEDDDWDDQSYSFPSGNLDSGDPATILAGETIVITYKTSTQGDAADYLDFNNIKWDRWNQLKLTGNYAFALTKNDIIIDAIGTVNFPGQGWETAGFGEATKESQLTRKDTVVGGNADVDCLDGTNNNACWNQSAGTSVEDSEWVYNEDGGAVDICRDDCWNKDECLETCDDNYSESYISVLGQGGCLQLPEDEGGCGIANNVTDFTENNVDLTPSQLTCAASCLEQKVNCEQACDDAVTLQEIACRDECDSYHGSIDDINSFNTIGNHYCSICDNELIITITDNLPPVPSLDSAFSESAGVWSPAWSAQKGSTVTLDASSSSDPEGSVLEFSWSSDILLNNGIEFSSSSESSIQNEIVSFTIPIDFPENSIDDIELAVFDGALSASLVISIDVTDVNTAPVSQIDFISTISDQFSYSLSSDENNLFNQCLINSCSEWVDANNLSDAYNAVNDEGSGNYETSAETCYINCIEQNLLVDNELQVFYEGYAVDLSGSNSTDATNTGVLTYTWSIASDNGGPDIELENAANENLSITMPSLDESSIGNDYNYTVTLSVSDGDLANSDTYSFTLQSRIPKLVLSDSSFESVSEGSFLLLDASNSEDPDAVDLSDVSFERKVQASDAKALVLSGYCDTNPSISCDDLSCNGNCVDSESTAFVFIPKSIGEAVEYTVKIKALKNNSLGNRSHEVCVLIADNDGNQVDAATEQGKYDECILETVNEEIESVEKKITIKPSVIEPVSNAGYTFKHLWLNDDWSGNSTPHPKFTLGTDITLNGYRSYDPQEAPVESSYWAYDCGVVDACSNQPEEWEDPPSSEDLKVIAFYDEINGLTAADNYVFNWYLEGDDSNIVWNSNEVNPTYLASETGTYEFKLYIENTSEGTMSDTSSVSVDVVANASPTAIIGDYRIYNKSTPGWYNPPSSAPFEVRYLYGVDSSDDDKNDKLRALVGSEYTLIGEHSYDGTPYQDLSYTWTPPDGIILSDTNASNASFTIPTDLCDDGVSLTERLCCENANHNWSSILGCIDSNNEVVNNWVSEKELQFTLSVSDGDTSVDPGVVAVTLVYSTYTAPNKPSLYATSEHSKINLFWNSVAENSIDDLTKYADFQGYRLYKSIDYGQTWMANDGDIRPDPIYQTINGVEKIVGWEPYAQFHANAERDSSYCLYKNDFQNCDKNDLGELTYSGEDVRRFDNIKGTLELPDFPEYYWIDYGSADADTGLVQSFVDENVIDGVEYTYMLTSYDSGVRPDTLQTGSFGGYELDAQGDPDIQWNSNIWSNGKPLHSFKEFVKADSFYFYKMHTYNNPKYVILESSIGCKDEWGIGCNSEDFESASGADGLVYKLQIPQEFINAGLLTVDQDGHMVEDKIDIMEQHAVWPASNPDQFPAMYSLESDFCTSRDSSGNFDDPSCVTLSPGYKASNITFPDDSQLDEFIAKDCEAIGDGDKYYEIIDESQFISGLVRLEIKAGGNGNGFENYLTDDACLYAYRVEKLDYSSSKSEYVAVARESGTEEDKDGYLYSHLVTENSGSNKDVYPLENGGYLNNGDECDPDEVSDSLDPESGVEGQCDYNRVANVENDPGVSIDTEYNNQLEIYIHIPNYLLECHELSFADDLDAVTNWTDFFGGIRMRLDNALREEPVGTEGAALSDLYSAPDSSLANRMYEDPTYGRLLLKYFQGSFVNKPSYDYEIELSTSYIDTAYFSDYGGGPDDFDHTNECGRSFGTPLPVRVKNLTTGKYVRIGHKDIGIWNQVDTEVPSWYSGDKSSHPGNDDCSWSPGEWLTFYDDVISDGDDESSETATFNLELSYTARMVANYRPDLCSDIETFDPTKSYSKNSCISDGENTTSGVWRAGSDVSPSDNNGLGFIPTRWYEGVLADGTIGNINPWSPVYPWKNGANGETQKIVIKPQKWFVNGDYWIADMSMLGQASDVTQDDLSQISVVPNPYKISSRFNESSNSNRLRFTHLPQKCIIKIYTISGEFVDEIIHNDTIDGNEYWDLKNSSGKKVAPGLYIYIVQTDNGKSLTGKFAIIR